MRKLILGLRILFAALTFMGAGYVLYTGGGAGAGYAVVPMVFCLCFSGWHRRMKEKGRR